MTIVKHEIVELSTEEKKTLDLAGKIFENIANTATDPNLIAKARQIAQRFYQFYVYLKHEEIK